MFLKNIFLLLSAAIIFSEIITDVCAQSKEISLDWKCDQSYNTKVPLSETIKFRLDAQSKKVFSKDFEVILSKAYAESQFDFFDCFHYFLNSARYSRSGDITRYVRNLVAQYGAQSFSKSAISPYEPGEDSRLEITKKQQKLIDNWSNNPCRLNLNVQKNKILEKKFLEEQLPRIVNKMKVGRTSDKVRKCLANVAQVYLDALLDSSLSPNQCATFPDICSKRYQSIQKTLSMISRISDLSPFFESVDKGISSCSSEGQRTNKVLYELNRNVNDIVHIQTCVTLKPGESNLIGWDYSGSGVYSDYVLTRMPPANNGPSYVATVNLKFQQEDKNEFDENFNQQYIFKTKKCLSEIQDRLRGPNGEILSVQLYEKNSFKNTIIPSEIFVEITKDEIRDNSLKWSPNSDCPTITHEIFHHLGLVDEYEEVQRGVKIEADGSIIWVENDATFPQYNCRTLGPEDSIMHNPHKAFDKIHSGLTILACQCGGTTGFGVGSGYGSGTGGMDVGVGKDFMKEERADLMTQMHKQMEEFKKKCFQKLNNIPVNSDRCPGSTSKIEIEINFADLKSNSYLKDQVDMAKKNEFDKNSMSRVIRVQPHKKNESLLYPAHYRAITQPGCSTNHLYYSCAKQAEWTSRYAYGEKKCNHGVPQECLDGGATWLK